MYIRHYAFVTLLLSVCDLSNSLNIALSGASTIKYHYWGCIKIMTPKIIVPHHWNPPVQIYTSDKMRRVFLSFSFSFFSFFFWLFTFLCVNVVTQQTIGVATIFIEDNSQNDLHLCKKVHYKWDCIILLTTKSLHINYLGLWHSKKTGLSEVLLLMKPLMNRLHEKWSPKEY